MRKAYGSYFVENKDGKLYGVNFGSDFTSEHEWGIDHIKKDFGVNNCLSVGGFGLINNTVTTVPSIILSDGEIDDKHYTALLYLGHYAQYMDQNIKFEKMVNNFELNPYESDLVCSWDDSTFGLIVSDKYQNEIKQLYDAFQNKDISVWIPVKYFDNYTHKGGDNDNFLKSSGLNFFITSRIPEDIVKKIYTQDEDRYNLIEAANKTGIYQVLEDAGKRYFALSPRWKDDKKKSVIFWLNPMEQDKYNYGWFTVNDLKDWAENKGKIIMTA